MNCERVAFIIKEHILLLRTDHGWLARTCTITVRIMPYDQMLYMWELPSISLKNMFAVIIYYVLSY